MPEIVLECKPDEVLIKSLGYTRKMITHQANKGEVVKYLIKNPGAIGIVDQDPGSTEPSFMKDFQKIDKIQFDIDCRFSQKWKTKLIVLRPRLEEWVVKYAKVSKLKLANYSLPNTGKELHKIINSRLKNFERLLEDMHEAKNEALLHLKESLNTKID
ncbi:hypothetical protein QQ020_33270 [Fulvivirgaceae bacterium BMA12]|uniref:Uncharacterized protein n=1 Tax=Agaribacillus aureus TaxID=3051825 RepID=A0ABT8LGQ3_9BACT|nr:hypothetical protein [Fulvivirgaceae bacterium BMA12]